MSHPAGHPRHVLSGLTEGEGNKSTLCKSFPSLCRVPFASAPSATAHTSEPRARAGEQHKVTGQTFANPEKPQPYPPTERGVSQLSKKHSAHVMFSPHSHRLCPVLFPTRISPGLTSHLLGGTLSCLSSKASHSFCLALLPPPDLFGLAAVQIAAPFSSQPLSSGLCSTWPAHVSCPTPWDMVQGRARGSTCSENGDKISTKSLSPSYTEKYISLTS